MELTLRPITPDDQEFLSSVYAGTREEELARITWDAAQKEAFLRMQFSAQTAYYRENYPGAAFDVIVLDGIPVGRLYVHRRPQEIRIVDISLLSTYRGRGIGSTLLQEILAEAERSNRPVTIHVERFNPALALYMRLGFNQAADRGVYLFLEWKPVPQEEPICSTN